jgi:hypothetical protein
LRIRIIPLLGVASGGRLVVVVGVNAVASKGLYRPLISVWRWSSPSVQADKKTPSIVVQIFFSDRWQYKQTAGIINDAKLVPSHTCALSVVICGTEKKNKYKEEMHLNRTLTL